MNNNFVNINGYLTVTTGDAVRLVAYISSSGLHGEIRFEPNVDKTGVRMRLSLKATLQYPEQQWSWWITEFPVDYRILSNRCNEQHLGRK